MLIVLALVIGAAIGVAAQYALRGRELRGAAIGPLLGAGVGALAWSVLTWLGLGPDAPWTWLVSIAAPALIVPPVLLVLARKRAAADARTRTALGI